MNNDNLVQQKLPIVVLISGSGSNLQAIIDATQHGLPVEIRAVISNIADAYGLTRAQTAGIPHHCISHRDYPSRTAFETALQQQIDAYQPKIVVLAGFMRYLTADFVQHYFGRMINIHPSLLPKYQGLHTHQAALAAKDPEHGATIHFVTEDLDQGPIISQGAIPIKADDTEESLQQRVLTQIEHRLYPQTLEWFAAGRVELRGDEVYFDGKPLPKQGKLFNVTAQYV